MEITSTLNHLRERVRSGEPVTADELEHIVYALDALETEVLDLRAAIDNPDLPDVSDLLARIEELEAR